MEWKRIGKGLLFPPIALLCVLVPAAAALLLAAALLAESDSPLAILSYVVSAYALTAASARLPALLRRLRTLREENRFLRRWRSDARLRVSVSLGVSLVSNTLYALLHLGLGLTHRTFWFLSLGGYYLLLAGMRLFLGVYMRRYTPGERRVAELRRYRACGWVFLGMNLALALIVFFMVYWDRTFTHHMITAIAMAAYTFGAFAAAVVGAVRYRRYESPVMSASKAIGLTEASVSMLTLTATMLTAFGEGTMAKGARRAMLGSVGFAVSAAVVAMAVYMIVQSTKKLKQEKKGPSHGE